MSRDTVTYQELSISSLTGGLFNKVRKHYYISSVWLLVFLLFLFGNGTFLSAVFQFFTLGYTPKPKKIKMIEFNLQKETLNYENSKGWFSCDQKCTENYKKVMTLKNQLKKIKNDYNKKLSDAKKEVGLLSHYGVTEAKNLFWGYFRRGKETAKTMSLYDVVFSTFISYNRDEGLISFLFRALMSVFINFTVSLISALLGFSFSLFGLIRSYQPNLITAVLFFVFCIIGASTFVLCWIFGLVTATTSVIIGIGTVLGSKHFRLLSEHQRRARLSNRR